jgi:hypothetical protein
VALLCLPFPALSQVQINEFLASNLNGLLDEDGDTSDWIELFNSTEQSINLNDWALSDDEDEPMKWLFKDTVILPNDHLLVFASGKDRSEWAGFLWNKIDRGDIWQYHPNEDEGPSEGWQFPDFDDSSWPSGPTGIGFGDFDDATAVPPCISISMRRSFHVPDSSLVRNLIFHIDYDDAFLVWLNGEEILRIGFDIPPPDSVPWWQTAASQHEAQMYSGGNPTQVIHNSALEHLRSGENILAIEVHNYSIYSPDMSMIPFLTLSMNEEPPEPPPLPEAIKGLFPKLHTNFKISAEGEELLLFDAGASEADEIDTGAMYADISRGRSPDGAADWNYFSPPTPEEANGEGYAGFAAPPLFLTDGGYRLSPFELEIWSSDSTQVFYTFHGKLPTQSGGADSSFAYTTPIPVLGTSVIRARAFQDGRLPSPVVSHSYIFEEVPSLCTVSLVSDPYNLWDTEYGIHVLGDSFEPEAPHYGANFWEDWERPVHVEFIETDGSSAFRTDAGIKIYGGWSRVFPQKSLNIVARSGYGSSRFHHAIFDDIQVPSFKHLLLRNSGSDFWDSHLRDAYMQALISDADLDTQAYRPARVYLNGQYWGLLNLREKKNEYFLEDHYGIDHEEIDILEHQSTIVEGDNTHYLDMLNFIEANSMADSANYEWVKSQMDVDEFANYNVAEIFYSNTDWPGNNIRFWRPQTPGGRWRWIPFDLDFGLGADEPYTFNTLAFALEEDGPSWPNPPWSTFLLRSLLESDEFRQDFINCFADHMNSTFHPDRSIPLFDSLASRIEEEVLRHSARWGLSIPSWYNELDLIREFLANRSSFMRDFIRNEFSLPGLLNLSLDISPPGSGHIQLTACSVDSSWEGIYFQEVPIPLLAVPGPGMIFAGWSDESLPQEESITIQPSGPYNYQLTALFELADNPGTVVINEINYHSADNFDTEDWVELHNPGGASIDLGGWIFRDGNDSHNFVFPELTILPKDGYLVLCCDSLDFRSFFPDAEPILGNLSFGFSGSGEALRLFDNEGTLFDYVEYDDSPPWPTQPDGLGPTLELLDALAENADPANWGASNDHGTPCERNSVILTESQDASPPALSLGLPFPNPFNPKTEIRLSLDRIRFLSLAVHDVEGRRVCVLASGSYEAGEHTFRWVGRDEQDQPVASGVYLLRFETEGDLRSRKLLLLK